MKLCVMTIGFPTKAVILRWPSRCCSMSSGLNEAGEIGNPGAIMLVGPLVTLGPSKWFPSQIPLQLGIYLSIYLSIYLYVCVSVCVYPLICCTSKRSNKSTKGDADHCSQTALATCPLKSHALRGIQMLFLSRREKQRTLEPILKQWKWNIWNQLLKPVILPNHITWKKTYNIDLASP